MKTSMLAMLAMAMMNDPLVHDLFCGSDRDPRQEKDPNSPESKEKLAKAEAKRKRKAEKMKQDAIRSEIAKMTNKEGKQ